ncbi:BspA family leucine-rich repeat surface protein [Mycoplasma mycoides]|uniref:BspA family leucine-rich repeat surface protein n=1 Tax=Mycoplasma mycoides TaxID=2102 RepID=UPI00223F1468|nr:BspA family leucine-rich repeat surface protein [Mycoplasma mycoides]
MKKLLTILTSTSAIFLITAGIVLVNKEDNLRINYNITYYQRNEIKDGKLVKIGYYQWGKHKRIEQIPTTINVIAAQLPKEITSLRYAFAGARHNVTWEVKWDTSNVTDMNSLFYGRDQFNSSDILDWDTSNVTDMSEMFAGATEFNQDLSKWNVSKVKDMSKMFNGAISFTYDLSSWELSNNVKKDNFGLNEEKQPKWKKLEETLAVKNNETTTNLNSSPKQTSPKTPDTSDITNNNIWFI